MLHAVKPLLTAFLLFAAVSALPAGGDLISVHAEGSSQISEDNYLSARNAAHASALEKAVWKVIRVLLPSHEIEINRETIETVLIARKDDFVQSYKYISEEVDEESKKYRLNIEFTFFIGYMRQAISDTGIKVEGGDRQKIVVVIDERALGVVPDSSFLFLPSTAEETMAKSISRLGYFVIDRAEIRKLDEHGRVLEAIAGDDDAVTWLGNKYNATYLVLGRARSATRPSGDGGMPWVEGEIDAKIYSTKSPNAIWSEKVVKRIEGSDGTAGFRAIRFASQELSRKVVDFIENRVTDG